ncbi:hypothetical protein A9Q87_00385 [Flavobacteriales bacterium 34_180_T64]|nr:hypothetical protein A9Q87_00385 [Flavobacteriales bacterium 34_180_T64]
MKNIFTLALIVLTLSSCQKETHDFTLNATIKGLKKGVVYLERQQDSSMVVLDSLVINGNSNFQLHSDLSEPEVLFLRLDKNDSDEGVIVFFADKGTTEITSDIKNFNFLSIIKGSRQQAVLDEYLLMMSKFNNKNLDMIKENFEAQIKNDSVKVNSIEEGFNNLLKRKYLYTINFAVNNKNSEVAPYLAISEIPNTSVKFLETIYEALDENIKQSMYGRELKSKIEERSKSN